MIDFTTVVAVDQQHAKELALVWPTWKKFRPELFQRPLKLLCDSDLIIPAVSPVLDFVRQDHPNVEFVGVPPLPRLTQRERMLSALTLIAPWTVKTPWLLKLDTDTVATASNPDWCHERIVDGSPVFAAHPWGYTKPADAVQRLDTWAATVPELKERPALNLPFEPGGRIVVCKGRIISWCFFGRTDWCRWATTLCGRLPVPSHDTYLWYVARRHGDPFKLVNMKRLGWAHAGRRLAETCQAVLGEKQHGHDAHSRSEHAEDRNVERIEPAAAASAAGRIGSSAGPAAANPAAGRIGDGPAADDDDSSAAAEE